MPNYCENVVTIEGPAKDVTGLLEAIRDGDQPFSFAKVLPVPPDVDADLWCSTEWGTDREPLEEVKVKVARGGRSVSLWVFTSWSPPRGILKALHKRFPTLTITLEYDQPEPPRRAKVTYKAKAAAGK